MTTSLVRSACGDDIDRVVALNRLVQALHAQAEPRSFKAEVDPRQARSFFEGLLSASRMRLMVAERDGGIVGYLWFELQEPRDNPFKFPRRRLDVHHLVVDVAARGQGVGSALMTAVETECRERGIYRIAVDTWSFNHAAQRFFRKGGFETFNLVMRKSLS